MANITIEIPSEQLPRIITAMKLRLVTGDAVDLDNPTNQEIIDNIKKTWIEGLKKIVSDHEHREYNKLQDSFQFVDLDGIE